MRREVDMSSSATVQVRIDERTKTQAKKVLDALHLSMSEAICLFLRQVVLHRGIPFEVKIPNALTRETLEKSERGEDVKEFGTVEELFEDLGL
ncbi:MAG: type II toxin-antitoxin system RelB/DinJ family antitoxin [Planctomycetes bacterium]|nr:type II toxin-antitoxin system RelB/DinJ family antitoxin [Planctomycetota bacterium]